MTAIPKIIHFIWVGDESKRPDNCFESWRKHNPDWTFLIWGNAELNDLKWHNKHHMTEMFGKELNGVADMMRWEILHANGGIVVDADSIAPRPIDDHLLECEAFACWENEIIRPGLIAAGYFGSVPGNAFVKQIVRDIHDEPTVTHDLAWKTVGPQRLTDAYRKYRYSQLRIYPSHYFIPQHFTGLTYEGNDPVYAHQLWAGTRRTYDHIHKLDVSAVDAVPVKPMTVKAEPQASAPAEAAPVSRLDTVHNSYFVQHVPVSSDIAKLGRVEVLADLCRGKRVLHVGCADWPITDVRTSLHVALEPVCAALDGVDVHAEALDMLRPHVRGALYGSLAEATGQYDLVLVPEVMEHVANVPEFLAQLEAIDAGLFLLSVPDAYQCRTWHFDYNVKEQTFVEVVHPDHNVWYTPYTLSNTIAKYSNLKVEKLWFFNRISILALLSKAEMAMAA